MLIVRRQAIFHEGHWRAAAQILILFNRHLSALQSVKGLNVYIETACNSLISWEIQTGLAKRRTSRWALRSPQQLW